MSLPVPPASQRNDRRLVFTSSQAARYLGVSLATIRRWTDAGHVSCYRTPGGQRRFSRDQLDEFIASMQRAGRGEAANSVERPATAAARVACAPVSGAGGDESGRLSARQAAELLPQAPVEGRAW